MGWDVIYMGKYGFLDYKIGDSNMCNKWKLANSGVAIMIGFSCVLSAYAIEMPQLLAAQNPVLSPIEQLTEDSSADKALLDIIQNYSSQRQERSDRHELVLVYQSDLDQLYEFSTSNKDKTAGLTAKLLMGIIGMSSNRRSDAPQMLPILESIVLDYPKTWQAAIAQVYVAFTKTNQSKSKHQLHTQLEKICIALEQVLPIARSLDKQEDAAVEAFRLVLPASQRYKIEAFILDALGSSNEKLGREEEAQKNYDAIIENFPGTKAAKRAKFSLKNQERRRKEGRKVEDTLPKFDVE